MEASLRFGASLFTGGTLFVLPGRNTAPLKDSAATLSRVYRRARHNRPDAVDSGHEGSIRAVELLSFTHDALRAAGAVRVRSAEYPCAHIGSDTKARPLRRIQKALPMIT
ncbi:MAG: hypothetical protein WDN30_06280 [Pararobbsia sp.]